MIVDLARLDRVQTELRFSTERVGRLRKVIERGESLVGLYEKNRELFLKKEQTYISEIEILTIQNENLIWWRRGLVGLLLLFTIFSFTG